MTKVNRVLLIVPPALTFKARRDINPMPPMGLGYLAAVVDRMGVDVRILDALMLGWEHEEDVSGDLVRVGLSDDDIRAYIEKYDPDVVGVTCQFSRQHRVYSDLFSLIKAAKPNCVVVAGGAHATVCPEHVLRSNDCDYLLCGEAEVSFKEFIFKVNEGKDLSSIDGLCWMDGDRLHLNKKVAWVADLDSISFPAYDIMHLEKYFGGKVSHGYRSSDRYSPIITSRGCPIRCTFCSAHRVWGDRYRLRSLDNVIEEMKLLKNKYGVEELMFEDDNLTANLKRARMLFSRMIEERLGFVWDTPNGVGVWNIDCDLIDMMKASGCLKLNFPVESGSQRVLKEIVKKPVNLEKVESLMEHCRKIGLEYGMFLVIGLPGESVQDIKQSFRFAARCECYSPHVSIATPYPGSDLYQRCEDGGYFAHEYRLEDLFIKSFMIKTPQWDGRDLRRLLVRGLAYLKLKYMLRHPLHMLRWVCGRIRRPAGAINYIRLILGRGSAS